MTEKERQLIRQVALLRLEVEASDKIIEELREQLEHKERFIKQLKHFAKQMLRQRHIPKYFAEICLN